jgi:hypothetical protein
MEKISELHEIIKTIFFIAGLRNRRDEARSVAVNVWMGGRQGYLIKTSKNSLIYSLEWEQISF